MAPRAARLSMAYAGAKFTNAVLRGLNGEKGIVTPTFVKSPLFADRRRLFLVARRARTHWRAEDPPDRRALSAEEQKLLEACLLELKKNIEKGKAFVA
ncbi:hypothetical protein DFH09DRAFT_1314370 [Mycena vulgaris]|nr:hypothetical protein DFH09DRAFT_1314370 [Mycena vulgaris]